MRAVRACFMALFVTGAVLAQDKPAAPAGAPPASPKPDTPEQAADAALAAWKANDDGALKALALKDNPDPWIVADELLARSEPAAAEAFAKAAPRKDVERLPDYVASRRGKPDDGAARKSLAAANAALAAKSPKDALEALGPADAAAPTDVVGIRRAFGRGVALAAVGRMEESAAAYLVAAAAAERAGWLARASKAFYGAGSSAYGRSDYRGALSAWERHVVVAEARGDRAGVAATFSNIGRVYSWLGNYAMALEYGERALKMQEEQGDRAGVAATLGRLGADYTSVAQYQKALEYLERALKMSEELGDRVAVSATLGGIGNVHYFLGNFARALEYQERSLKIMEDLGGEYRAQVAGALVNLGTVEQSLGSHTQALAHYERALTILEETGNRPFVAQTLINIGTLQSSLGNYMKALEYQERALKVLEELGNRAYAALTLGNIGAIHAILGDYAKALEYLERALKMQEDMGDRTGVASALANIGSLNAKMGNYPRALEYLERALRMREELGEKAEVAAVRANLGTLQSRLGNFTRALEELELALKIAEGLGDHARAAVALNAIGGVYYSRGSYTKALEHFERALKLRQELGDKAGIADALAGVALVHYSLGDYAKALGQHEKAMKTMEEIGDRAGVARMLGFMGRGNYALGDLPRALEELQESLRILEDIGDRNGVEAAWGEIGIVQGALGDSRAALECYERALKTKEELGDRAGVARTLRNSGDAQFALGDYSKALDAYQRSLSLSVELGLSENALAGLSGLACTHLAQGAPLEAVRDSHEAVRTMAGLVGGLAEGEGAYARGRLAVVFETGVRAAMALEDPSEASYFLESGRAGTLLEGLGSRARLQEQLVPEELREAEALARAREAVALALYRHALDGGDLAETKRLRSDFDAARDGVKDVIDHIQREAKKGADVVYPKAAELSEIRAMLGEGETLVLYGIFSEDAMALVVTGKDARIVDLGKTKPIEAAYEAAMLEETPFVDEGKFGALRDLVTKPLGLRGDVKRVLVSPHGVISYAPVSMLFPDHEVVEVPSGTTYRLLTEDRSRTGVGVLALGDPDVNARPDPIAVALYVEGVRARGGGLGRLPSAREEAKAVGDVLLLDKEATEAGLSEAVAKRPRWHAVHFACHGLVDPERPTLSSLALTPSGDDDGFLTVLDVFRMKIPADLVVLSACETGKGRIVKGEGIVGLTRAFMFAGAPRVLVSLWKVDDEATKALMVKFYELWNAGKAPATALREAQTFVRSQEKWKHPYYWAAWVLWGLPE